MSNIRYLFPQIKTEEEAQLAAHRFIGLVDSFSSSTEVDTSTQGGICAIRFLASRRYLEVLINYDGVTVDFEGKDSSDSELISGRTEVGESVKFLGHWLDET